MSLVWSERGGYVAAKGRDRDGLFMCQVQGQNGHFAVYLAPWAVGDGGSQWLEGFETVEEAMGAAERWVVDYRDSRPT